MRNEEILGPNERAAWEEILQSMSGKVEAIRKKPLTDDLVDELLLNRMWQWKPIDTFLLSLSMPGKFFHAVEIEKIHHIIRKVARTCRDAAKGVLREDWEVVCRHLGVEDKDVPLPSGQLDHRVPDQSVKSIIRRIKSWFTSKWS